MTREEFIDRLKYLIADYDYEERNLEAMKERWENEDDPGSDPGLQYEQENNLQNSFDQIIEFVKTSRFV